MGSRAATRRGHVAPAALVLLVAAATTAGAAGAGPGETGLGPVGTPSSSAASERIVRITAVGDVVMGVAPRLPEDGDALFGLVTGLLAGNLVLGNLDQAITDSTASSKCAPGEANCYAFRTPSSTARWLADAGFTVVNLANNHTRDFGPAGLADTVRALDAAGVQHTGLPGETTYAVAGDVRVAVLGFAPYGWTADLLDIPGAVDLVEQADARADVVVVTIHAGAEGAEHQHVRPGTETFLGEDRGDPVAFSHAVVDAGADVVLGAGPHVLRGLEFRDGRLIAYSLGNFAGYAALSNSGPNGVGAVLTVELTADGGWAGGRLEPTVMVDPGVPRPDPAGQAVTQVQQLSAQDFGRCAADLADDGTLGAPPC